MKKLLLLLILALPLLAAVIPMRFDDTTGVLVDPRSLTIPDTLITPPNAIAALVINVAKAVNTKSVSADSTFTFSATPAAGTWFSLILTESGAAVRTITIPSSFSIARGAAITTLPLPANAVAKLDWYYDGATYRLWGDPVNIGHLTADTTPAGTDYIEKWNGTIHEKSTITEVLALGGGGGLPTSPFFGDEIMSDGTNGFNGNLRSVIKLEEEFFWASGLDPTPYWNKIGGTINYAGAHGDASHIGAVRLRTTATGLFGLSRSDEGIRLGASTVYVEWIVSCDNISDDTNDFILVVGLADLVSDIDQVDGVFFRYNDDTNGGDWEGVCESNSVETVRDTNVVFTTGWVRLGILITNASSVQFYINGSAAGAAVTTNIPNGAGRETGIMYIADRTLGATERNHYLDAMRFVAKPTTPR